MWRRIALVVAALVAATGLAAVPRSTVAEADALQDPITVMLVGDSITSGQTLVVPAGATVAVERTDQWPTFRGALYEKLTGAGSDIEIGAKFGHDVDFVGSEDGVGTTFDDSIIDTSPGDDQNLACPSTSPAKVVEIDDVTLSCDYANAIDPDPPTGTVPYPLVDPDHEGHNGWTVDELVGGRGGAEQVDGSLAGWMAAEQPDIVVLYAGTNDLGTGQAPVAVIDEIRGAIDLMQAAKPYVRIVVPQLHPHKNNLGRTQAIVEFNALVPNLVRESTETSPVITADLFTGYCALHQPDPDFVAPSPCPHYNADGSHPNQLGHALIARRLGDAMEASGYFEPVPTPAPPTVDAGPDLTVSLPGPAVLDGTASGAASVTWSRASGPGSVTFSTPTATDTTARFGAVGTYTLRLTATNPHGSVSDATTVTVTASAAGPGPGSNPPGSNPPGSNPGEGSGYFVLEGDGDLYAFGDARPLLRTMDPAAVDVPSAAATISRALAPQLGTAAAVTIEKTADDTGLWVLLDDGRILRLGSAAAAPGVSPAVLTRTVAGQPERVSAMTRVGTGDLWVFTTAGRVVPQFGALPAPVATAMDVVLGLDLLGPVIDAKPTVDGAGVVAMAADGGIFTYNAPFLGSVYDAIASVLGVPVGSVGPDRPVVGVTMDPDADGYWVVAEDGGVFTMRTPFRGALPAIIPFDQLVSPVNGMVPLGNGYLLVAGDGGVFNFSDQPFSGSASGLVDSAVVAIAAL